MIKFRRLTSPTSNHEMRVPSSEMAAPTEPLGEMAKVSRTSALKESCKHLALHLLLPHSLSTDLNRHVLGRGGSSLLPRSGISSRHRRDHLGELALGPYQQDVQAHFEMSKSKHFDQGRLAHLGNVNVKASSTHRSIFVCRRRRVGCSRYHQILS